MIKYIFPLLFLVACTSKLDEEKKQPTVQQSLDLTLLQAERLSGLLLKCIQ